MSDEQLLSWVNKQNNLFYNNKKIKYSDKDILKYRYIFEKYFNEYKECDDSANLLNCQQKIPGYRLKIKYLDNEFHLYKDECNHLIKFREKTKIKNNFLLYDFDDSYFTYTLAKNYEPNENNSLLLKKIIEFIKSPTGKGLYIWGKPGIGKTFGLILMSNALAELNLKICFISISSLVKQVKASFQNLGVFEKIMKDIKKSNVLVLDDIGGESITEWSRDELLFSIVNERMNYKKSTFFTSNYSIDDLEILYARTNNKIIQKSKNSLKIEEIKANRFVERIRAISLVINLKGENRRY